jgi:hypothetical protein
LLMCGTGRRMLVDTWQNYTPSDWALVWQSVVVEKLNGIEKSLSDYGTDCPLKMRRNVN